VCCLDVKKVDKLPITKIHKKAFQGVFPKILFSLIQPNSNI